MQDIYAKRTPLLWSLARYGFALMFWIMLICYTFHPINFKIHPDLSPLIYIPLIAVFVVIILYNFSNALIKSYRCIVELSPTPKLAYRISKIGFTDYRSNKNFEWNELINFRISPIGGDITAVLNGKTKPLIIEKRGLTSEDYNNILDIISSKNQST